MATLKELVEYAHSVKCPFNTIEEIEAAYTKHLSRVENRNYMDFIKYWIELNYSKRRSLKRRRRGVSYPCRYDFKEVLAFLKKRRLYGEQVFSCNGIMDHTECVYSKDGVNIYVCGDYGYYEVTGLCHYDFYVLNKAYERHFQGA